MLSVTEAMLIYQNRNNVEQADINTAYLEDVIARLQVTINSQAATIAAQKDQIVTAVCSLTGYRAYAEYMRTACNGEILTDASDAFVEAINCKAGELDAPHLKKQKTSARAAAGARVADARWAAISRQEFNAPPPLRLTI